MRRKSTENSQNNQTDNQDQNQTDDNQDENNQNQNQNNNDNGTENNTNNEPKTEDLEVKIKSEYTPITVNSVKYIKNIVPGTTEEEFRKSIITNGTVKLYYTTSNKEKTEYLKTGMKLKVEKNNQSVEYILVVTGDTTGDGKSNGADLLKVARYLAQLDNNLTGAYKIAADIKCENNENITINSKDLLKLARMLAYIE